MSPQPCVVVKTAPYGFESSFSVAVADVFTPDELTITSAEDDREIQVYRSGDWQEATVLCDGHVLYQFRSIAFAKACAERIHSHAPAVQRRQGDHHDKQDSAA